MDNTTIHINCKAFNDSLLKNEDKRDFEEAIANLIRNSVFESSKHVSDTLSIEGRDEIEKLEGRGFSREAARSLYVRELAEKAFLAHLALTTKR